MRRLHSNLSKTIYSSNQFIERRFIILRIFFTLWFQQPYESSLVKMKVSGQGFSNAALIHGDKTSTVNEAPFLVLSVLEQLPRRFVHCEVNMNDFNMRRSFQRLNERNHPRTGNAEWTAHQRD